MPAACYRALLRAYPPHYRARFGGDMLDTFVRDVRLYLRGAASASSWQPWVSMA